jgi:hypothetical protein
VDVLDVDHHRADKLRLTAPAPAAVPAQDERPGERSAERRRERQPEVAR